MKTVVLLLCVASCAAHMSFTERMLLTSAETECGKGKVAAAATAKCASDKCGKDDFVSGACCVNVQACSAAAGTSDTLKCAVSDTLVNDAAGACAGALCVAADFGDKDSNCCRTPPAGPRCNQWAGTLIALCGEEMVYDQSKAATECAATLCKATECCRTPNEVCSASTKFNNDTKCDTATTGQIYDTSKADTECAAAACVEADCCKAKPNEVCMFSDFNDDTKCDTATTGQIYDTSKAATECAAEKCAKTDCCKAKPNEVCKASDFKDDATCGDGFQFDISKADTECAAEKCAKTDCCKDPLILPCKFGNFGPNSAKCGHGFQIDLNKQDTECATATCVVAECCKATVVPQLCTAGVAAAKAKVDVALGSAATAAPSAVLAVCAAALFARL